MFGIYSITNTVNGKVYIGQTSKSFTKRFGEHLYELRNDRHHNEHLQRAWNHYGEDSFIFDILEVLNSVDQLNIREKFWIDYCGSFNKELGYNLTLGGSNGTPNAETRAKMSAAQSGENHPWWGKKNPKHSATMKERHKNYIHPMTGNGCLVAGENNGMYGKKHSEDARRKMTETRVAKQVFRGENNPGSKLNEEKVREIKRLLSEGNTQQSIADKFNLKQVTISDIKRGKLWKHVT